MNERAPTRCDRGAVARGHPHRGTIFLEEASILAHDAYPGGQFVLRLQAPKLAAHAQPGNFAHLQCDPALPMRRPMSVMRVDPADGWAEFLYKEVGHGTSRLAQRQPGGIISVLGPIGNPFQAPRDASHALLIGGGVGIPPMVFLAEQIKRVHRHIRPLVLIGSEVPFPFDPRPSQIMVPGMQAGVIGCMPLMEDWEIPSRLASRQGFAGCHDGFVTDLARGWLDALDTGRRRRVIIFACGPTPMLRATTKLAREYQVACQVCLEGLMACAVGGCAGCAVRIKTAEGADGSAGAMKRVCVDGPVFDGYAVAWD